MGLRNIGDLDSLKPIGPAVLGNTIGNAVANQVSGSQDTTNQAQSDYLSGKLDSGNQAYQYNADGTKVPLYADANGNPTTANTGRPYAIDESAPADDAQGGGSWNLGVNSYNSRHLGQVGYYLDGNVGGGLFYPNDPGNIQLVGHGLGLTPNYGGPTPLQFAGSTWLNYHGDTIQWPKGISFQDIYNSGVSAWSAQIVSPASIEIAAGTFFSPGGVYDFQRSPYPNSNNLYIDATSVAIGIWAAGAGLSLDAIQQMNNSAAWGFSHYTPQQLQANPLDPIYKNTTTRNVANINLGYKIGTSISNSRHGWF